MSMTLHTYVCIFGAKPELMIQIKVLPEHGLILEFNSRRWNETAKAEIQTVTESRSNCTVGMFLTQLSLCISGIEDIKKSR